MPIPDEPSDDIQFYSEVEHTRRRAELYLGTDDVAIKANCMAREAFCLAIDQIMSGSCSQIQVTVGPFEFSLSHNGNCPDCNSGEPDSTRNAAAILTRHFFCRENANHEYVRKHVCQLSLATVVHLSHQFVFDGFDRKYHWRMEFLRGESEKGMQKIGNTDRQGVELRFSPDLELLGETTFDGAALRAWFEQLPLPHETIQSQWTID